MPGFGYGPVIMYAIIIMAFGEWELFDTLYYCRPADKSAMQQQEPLFASRDQPRPVGRRQVPQFDSDRKGSVNLHR